MIRFIRYALGLLLFMIVAFEGDQIISNMPPPSYYFPSSNGIPSYNAYFDSTLFLIQCIALLSALGLIWNNLKITHSKLNKNINIAGGICLLSLLLAYLIQDKEISAALTYIMFILVSIRLFLSEGRALITSLILGCFVVPALYILILLLWQYLQSDALNFDYTVLIIFALCPIVIVEVMRGIRKIQHKKA